MAERTGSFPYFNIARDFRVPYAEVLQVVDDLDRWTAVTGVAPNCVLTMVPCFGAVHEAWLAEHRRRAEVAR